MVSSDELFVSVTQILIVRIERPEIVVVGLVEADVVNGVHAGRSVEVGAEYARLKADQLLPRVRLNATLRERDGSDYFDS